MNATGTYVPPLIMFSKVIYKNHFPVTDTLQDHEFVCHGLDESQLMKLAINFKIRNIKRFFPQRQWSESPADVRPIPHQTPKCSVPIYQAKQSRASCEKLLTASPYRQQL
jgi:hypothetical protein